MLASHGFRGTSSVAWWHCRRCGKINPVSKCCLPKHVINISRGHSTQFESSRSRPLTPIGRSHLLTSAGSANEEETNLNGEPPSVYRRPACPVNDKAEANRSHTQRKRGNSVEEVSSFTTGSRCREICVCFVKNHSGHYKLVRVDNQSLFQR